MLDTIIGFLKDNFNKLEVDFKDGKVKATKTSLKIDYGKPKKKKIKGKSNGN